MSTAKHLAIFLPSLNGGGAEKVMLALTENFLTRGIRCDLIIAMNKGSLLDRAPPGARLIILHKKKTINAIFALAKYIQHEKPDSVIATIFSANITVLLAKMMTFTKSRVVIREANPIDFDIQSKRPWKTFQNWLIAAFAYRKADAVILVSEGVRQSLLKWKLIKPQRHHVIRNPLTFEFPIRKTRGVNIRKIILACGRLEQEKDHATLLRAFAKIRISCCVELVILGEGSLLPALRIQAQELNIERSVTFAGYVSNPIEYMLQASVFAHTSRYEGCSNVLLEALATGCPIVATDCPGGVREVLADGKYGALIPVGDEHALAVALGEILNKRLQFPDATEYLCQFEMVSTTNSYLDVIFPNRHLRKY